ncbi:hypothetical protein INT47_002250 [Mucor saturninus]|uniref:Uncharacterized protein n=1 Tax=Mucor saturninus TaxID=64648 RepID=A0A8H7R8Q2_9FUNG|nr:hypothetical protein INT47_002250 [Mucor saturninus]
MMHKTTLFVLLVICLLCLITPIKARRLSKNKLYKRQGPYPPTQPRPGAPPDPGLAPIFGIYTALMEKTPAVPDATMLTGVFSGGDGKEA